MGNANSLGMVHLLEYLQFSSRSIGGRAEEAAPTGASHLPQVQQILDTCERGLIVTLNRGSHPNSRSTWQSRPRRWRAVGSWQHSSTSEEWGEQRHASTRTPAGDHSHKNHGVATSSASGCRPCGSNLVVINDLSEQVFLAAQEAENADQELDDGEKAVAGEEREKEEELTEPEFEPRPPTEQRLEEDARFSRSISVADI